MSGRDTFTELALDESLAGKAMDAGGLSWAPHTYFVGDGSGDAKLIAIPNGKPVAANVVLPAGAKRAAVRFVINPTKDFQQDVIRVTLHGSGSSSSQEFLDGVSASLGGYNALKITNWPVGSLAAEITYNALAYATEYELAAEWPDPVGKPLEYRAALYIVTDGVTPATPVIATPVITLPSARPDTARMSQIWGVNSPMTLTGYEWADSGGGGGGATINLAGTGTTQANSSGTSVASVNGAAPVASVTSDIVRGYDGLAKANFTIPNVVLLKLDRTVALSLANQVTNSTGRLVIANAALVAGTDYMLATFSADGLARGIKKVTAV